MAFFRDVREDIREAVKKDPAARNGFEVLLCYPGIWALIFHRPAHWLYMHNCKLRVCFSSRADCAASDCPHCSSRSAA